MEQTVQLIRLLFGDVIGVFFIKVILPRFPISK